jgi:hypothetical protein
MSHNREWCDDDRAALRPLHRDPCASREEGHGGLGRQLLKDILIAAGYVPVITQWSKSCERPAKLAWFCDRRLVAIDRRQRRLSGEDSASEDDTDGEPEQPDTDASDEEPVASDPSGKGMYI